MKTSHAMVFFCLFSHSASADLFSKNDLEFSLEQLFSIEDLFEKKEKYNAPINFIIEKLGLVDDFYQEIQVGYKPNSNYQQHFIHTQYIHHIDNFTLLTTPMYYLEIENDLQIGFTYFPEFLANTFIDGDESFFFSVNYKF